MGVRCRQPTYCFQLKQGIFSRQLLMTQRNGQTIQFHNLCSQTLVYQIRVLAVHYGLCSTRLLELRHFLDFSTISVTIL